MFGGAWQRLAVLGGPSESSVLCCRALHGHCMVIAWSLHGHCLVIAWSVLSLRPLSTLCRETQVNIPRSISVADLLSQMPFAFQERQFSFYASFCDLSEAESPSRGKTPVVLSKLRVVVSCIVTRRIIFVQAR